MIEIRCCCTPENLIGYLPATTDLPLRELDDGTYAYSSEEQDVTVLPGFVANLGKGGGKKTWRKK